MITEPEHDLYKTGDADAPDAIKDSNGEVTLGLCRKCGKGEGDLVEPCVAPGAASKLAAELTTILTEAERMGYTVDTSIPLDTLRAIIFHLTPPTAPEAEPADWPECSGDPGSCPENEGYGCCKPNSAASDEQPPRRLIAVKDAIRGTASVTKVFPGDVIAEEYDTAPEAAPAGEVVAWRYRHADGDQGSWWDVAAEPVGGSYMQRMQADGCTIEYAYSGPQPAPDAQGGAVEAQIEAAGSGGPMSLAVAFDFADHPRPIPSLAAPADTNGELYKALRVLAAEARRLAATAQQPVAVDEAIEVPHQECYSNDDGDTWLDSPEDAEFIDGLALGDEFELSVSHYSIRRTYRVTKVPGEDSDDYEVEPVTAALRSGSQPPTVDKAWLRDVQRCLYDVATEMRARGRSDSRFIQLIARAPALKESEA